MATKYYLLRYVGNTDKSSNPKGYIDDVIERDYRSDYHSISREHFESLNMREKAPTLGVQVEDGPIVDYCSGIEVTEEKDIGQTGRLVYDKKTEITPQQYYKAYALLHPADRQIEFMNMQRYLVGLKQIINVSKKEDKNIAAIVSVLMRQLGGTDEMIEQVTALKRSNEENGKSRK